MTKGTSAMNVIHRLQYDSTGNVIKAGTVKPTSQDTGLWSGTLNVIAEGILAAKKYYMGNIDVVFGDGMEWAVRAFQKARGLESDRIIGREIWTAMLGV